jgi:uncharacterized caspase-like protein
METLPTCRRCGLLAACLVFAALVPLAYSPLAAAARVALVIGNAGYDPAREWGRLANPVADARAAARVLRQLDLDRVILRTDLSRSALVDALDAFDRALAPGDTAFFFFFYSGHSVQLDDENYLVPVSAGPPVSPRRLRASTVP